MYIATRFNPIQHCLFPRRNEPGALYRKMENLRFNEKWLKRRIQLFKDFTYPSVVAQTDQDFEWIGVVHPESPKWFIDELKQFSRMQVVLEKYDVDAMLGIRGNGNITINLDCDDAIVNDFVKLARVHAKTKGLINFKNGLQFLLSSGLYNINNSFTNPFNIANGNVTVFDTSHGLYERESIDAKRYMWLQVVHDGNLMNRVRRPQSPKNNLSKLLSLGFVINADYVKD